MRVQLRRSRAPDSANVSDANVLDTTLLIFFEEPEKWTHVGGLSSINTFSCC